MPTIYSFGWKHGGPKKRPELAGVEVVDVRTLKNPHHNKQLRKLTGLYSAVRLEVSASSNYKSFYDYITKRLREGKSIAVGCTAGRHRSVAVAELCGHATGARTIHLDRVHWDWRDGYDPENPGRL